MNQMTPEALFPFILLSLSLSPLPSLPSCPPLFLARDVGSVTDALFASLIVRRAGRRDCWPGGGAARGGGVEGVRGAGGGLIWTGIQQRPAGGHVRGIIRPDGGGNRGPVVVARQPPRPPSWGDWTDVVTASSDECGDNWRIG